MHLEQPLKVVRQEQILINIVLEQARELKLNFDTNLVIIDADYSELMVSLFDR